MWKRVLAMLVVLGMIGVSRAAHADCGLQPPCVVPTLTTNIEKTWDHLLRSRLLAQSGAARHHVQDVLVATGDVAKLRATFAYGPASQDLEGESVDVYVLTGCGTLWSSKRATLTTDVAGKVNVDLPGLPEGRHRVRFVVRGDGTYADAFVQVVAKSAKVVVTDVDGTLTAVEFSVASTTVGAAVSAHPGAAAVLKALAEKGYVIVYVATRPEWMVTATREWLNAKGFPLGVLHTTTTAAGLTGAAAVAFKATMLAQIAAVTGPAHFGFGNEPSDVQAYRSASMAMARTYFINLTGDAQGGVVFTSYASLLPAFNALPSLCLSPFHITPVTPLVRSGSTP